jgi:hypothetical protein
MPLIPDIFDRLKDTFAAAPEIMPKQRKILIIIFSTLIGLLLLLLLLLLITRRTESASEKPVQHLTVSPPAAIPPEEIFLPEEPDFLPKILLEQEPHTWNEEDARPFWTNPLENNAAQWRNDMKTTVDRIMERVP